MTRRLRVEFPGAIHHVTVRMLGDASARLFRDDQDRNRLLGQLEARVGDYDIRLYAFCLMSNHFHLVVETPRANVQQFMQALGTAYSTYFNLRHRRHGHLYDGRYGSKLVEGDEYLLSLSRYVHLNPVRVKALRDRPLEERRQYLREYPWSSLHTFLGKGNPLGFVESGPLLAAMGGRRREAWRRYGSFVEEGLAEEDEELLHALKASPRCIGTEGFRRWADELYEKLAEGQAVSEDIAFRRTLVCLPPEQVLEVAGEELGVKVEDFRVRRHGSVLRGVAGRLLGRYAGLTQREASAVLGMGTGAAVCMQIKRLSERMATDTKLRRQISRIEKRLDDQRLAADNNLTIKV